MSDIRWWAYLHTNGHVQLKRYLSEEDLLEADESPFVQERTESFEANNREEAEVIAKEKLL